MPFRDLTDVTLVKLKNQCFFFEKFSDTSSLNASEDSVALGKIQPIPAILVAEKGLFCGLSADLPIKGLPLSNLVRSFTAAKRKGSGCTNQPQFLKICR